MPIKFKEPAWLQKIHAPAWMVLILAIIFLLRIPSLFEPFYYGDEMIYLNLGEAINRGMVLYRDIHDNKPPLLYFLAAASGNVFWFRAILAGWMMATTVLFWKLAETLFPREGIISKTAVSVFAVLTTLPLLEGQIANAELFMLGPTIAAFLVLLTKKHSAKNLIFAGSLFSISSLFKIPAAFDFASALVFLAIIMILKKKGVRFFRQSIFLLIGFLTPIVLFVVWYYLRGALGEYIAATYLQNVGYLSSFRGDVHEPFFIRNASLFARAGVMVGGLSILFFARKKLSKEFMLIVIWLLFSLYAVTLSERPYPHYLVQLVPTVSLLMGILAARQTIEQSLTLIPLFLVGLTVIGFQFWYYSSFNYYQRFINYTTGRISQEEYLNSFDKNTTRNYKIAKFLATSSERGDKVFVWEDSPAIYAIANRLPPVKYVAGYHISDFSSPEEVIKKFSKNKPVLVVVLPEAPLFPLLEVYLRDYLLINEIDGAKIYKSIKIELNASSKIQ